MSCCRRGSMGRTCACRDEAREGVEEGLIRLLGEGWEGLDEVVEGVSAEVREASEV